MGTGNTKNRGDEKKRAEMRQRMLGINEGEARWRVKTLKSEGEKKKNERESCLTIQQMEKIEKGMEKGE